MADLQLFKFHRYSVSKCRVPVVGVVILDPCIQSGDEASGGPPFLDPGRLFLQGAHKALRVGISLGGVIAGEGLVDAHGPARVHEAHGRRLAAGIGHQVQSEVAYSLWKLAVDGHV